jgi:heme/copper-type cytochrome/quinol oxidase subunit 4
LLAQLILIFDAALTQFFPIISDWLPILDRAVIAFSLVILIWIWVFPESSRRADTATLLLSLIILVLTIFTGIWWLNQPGKTSANRTVMALA